ncbi:MAG: hypothetical protein ABEJ72_02690 [Candidatus Aenigmatarchaeota archaeon]
MNEPGSLEGLVGTFLNKAGPDPDDKSLWDLFVSGNGGMSTARDHGFTPGEVVGAFWLADLAGVELEGRRVTDPLAVSYSVTELGHVKSQTIEEAVESHGNVYLKGPGPANYNDDPSFYTRYRAGPKDAGGSPAQKIYLKAVADLAPDFEPFKNSVGLRISKRSEDYNFMELARSTAPVVQKRRKPIGNAQRLDVDPEDTEGLKTPDQTGVYKGGGRLPDHWDLECGETPSAQFYEAVNDYIEKFGDIDPQELHDPEPESKATEVYRVVELL